MEKLYRQTRGGREEVVKHHSLEVVHSIAGSALLSWESEACLHNSVSRVSSHMDCLATVIAFDDNLIPNPNDLFKTLIILGLLLPYFYTAIPQVHRHDPCR